MDIKGISRNDFYVLYNKKEPPGVFICLFRKEWFYVNKAAANTELSDELLGNARTTLYILMPVLQNLLPWKFDECRVNTRVYVRDISAHAYDFRETIDLGCVSFLASFILWEN